MKQRPVRGMRHLTIYIYFAQMGGEGGPIKIGRSIDPHLRVSQLACPACDGEGVVLSADRVRMHCGACDASGRAALATAKAKGAAAGCEP